VSTPWALNYLYIAEVKGNIFLLTGQSPAGNIYAEAETKYGCQITPTGAFV
jgi:hypothetical protein